MGNASRRKGLSGEGEVAALYAVGGFEVRSLEGAGDHLVVCRPGLTIHSETKRQERVQLPMWLRQAESEAPSGTVPVVAFRQSRGHWYAALRLADLIAIAGKV